MKLATRFPAPVRKPKNRNGNSYCVTTQEYNGSSNGVHTIALGICSIPSVKNGVNIDSPWFLLGCAILRKILKKHFGVSVEHVDQFIDFLLPPVFQTQTLTNTFVAEQPRLCAIRFYNILQNDQNANAVQSSEAFTVNMPLRSAAAADRTFRKVASVIGDSLKGYYGTLYAESIGGASGTPFTARTLFSLYGYSLEEMISLSGPDGTPALTDPTNRVWSRIHRCDNWIVDLSMKTKVRIQNISPSVYYSGTGATFSEGVTTSADNLEHNPLVGKIYHFSDPYPKVSPRVMSMTHNVSGPSAIAIEDFGIFMKDVDGDGVIKPNNSVTEDLVQLRHIPTFDTFSNITGYTPFTLRAGEIKTHVMHFKFNGYIMKLIRGLMATNGYDASVPANTSQYYGRMDINKPFGVHDMFFFEDYNGGHGPTGAQDPKIMISYQINRTQSCKVVKETHSGMQLIRNYQIPIAGVNNDAAS